MCRQWAKRSGTPQIDETWDGSGTGNCRAGDKHTIEREDVRRRHRAGIAAWGLDQASQPQLGMLQQTCMFVLPFLHYVPYLLCSRRSMAVICELAEWSRAPAGRNDETRSTTSTATREWVHLGCTDIV